MNPHPQSEALTEISRRLASLRLMIPTLALEIADLRDDVKAAETALAVLTANKTPQETPPT